ncbi:ABC transporter ATP-binding protein [Pediococcus parvulus]|uniref:ABC transporter ATP-binding protein n=1 Tax=Pediococcus parvulus TaxID=54062 RepID=A0AAP5TC69_9LACO|nr:ATP-binding cassette domain-containing protein [Pediococcus parvulus]MDV7693986.1 ATP-binding cassette domain-containing protein [Pediococcus parvulus]OAD63401.1 ABC transporter ATP-binding protein [Pediococcus parvulus]
MTPIITVDNVQKSFKKQLVLDNITLEVQPGNIYALLGDNGAGKSTLLKIITGLLNSDQGTVRVNDFDVNKQLRQIQRLFSFSAQTSSVDDILTGYENLALIAKLRHVANPNQTATDLLAQFKLTEAAKKRVADYSGGMRRRLDLAMSLVGNPEILFLDEPTTGLDPSSRNDLWQTIRDLKAQGKTIFLTTQYLEEADQLADQVGFLRDGKIIATGTPQEMKHLAGPEKLTLTFLTSDQLAQVLPLLHDFAVQTLDDVSISVELPESISTVLEILNRLTVHKLKPTTFQVTTPSLDDVFLKLTKGA